MGTSFWNEGHFVVMQWIARRPFKDKVEVTLRLAVYRQSVRLDAKPVELTTRDLFFSWTLCGHSPYVTPSLRRRWVCLLWICLAFRQVYISHIAHVIEISSFWTIYKSFVSPCFEKHIMPIVSYNGSLVTWTAVGLTAAKFKPLIFSVSGFALSYTANMFILVVLYDFCLLPAQFYYIIGYICGGAVENRVQIADRCAPWKISSGAENFVLQALQF
jgi:hypothetical protein